MSRAREILARFLGGGRLFIPLKPAHVNRQVARRRKRFEHVKPKEARSQSFKRFWRQERLKTWHTGAVKDRPAHPRKVRRAWAIEWYRENP